MHRLPSPGSICLTIYPMRIQKGINAGVTVIHNAGRLVKTCRDFLQSLSWGRAEEHNILSSDAFPNCLQPVQHQKRKRDQCLPSELCKTLQAPIEPGLCRREGYLRNFIGRSEVLFRWGGPRRLWWQTGFAELCHGIRQRGLPWETENCLSLSSEQIWFLRLQDKNNSQRMFNNARINHLTPRLCWVVP